MAAKYWKSMGKGLDQDETDLELENWDKATAYLQQALSLARARQDFISEAHLLYTNSSVEGDTFFFTWREWRQFLQHKINCSKPKCQTGLLLVGKILLGLCGEATTPQEQFGRSIGTLILNHTHLQWRSSRETRGNRERS